MKNLTLMFFILKKNQIFIRNLTKKYKKIIKSREAYNE